jgi:hypothetical protein
MGKIVLSESIGVFGGMLLPDGITKFYQAIGSDLVPNKKGLARRCTSYVD